LRLAEVWQCSNTAFEQNARFLRFSVLQGSAEALVRRGKKNKASFVADFLNSVSAKNCQNERLAPVVDFHGLSKI